MKVFAVVLVARQIEGEYIAIRAEKAFTQASRADAFMQEIKQQYQNKPMKVSTPHGELECRVEVGAFELEIVE